MSEFHLLSPSLQSKDTNSSNDMTSMDDVSLSSPRITTSKSSLLRGSSSGGGASSSSSVSVSSKFSRKSSSFRHSELATPSHHPPPTRNVTAILLLLLLRYPHHQRHQTTIPLHPRATSQKTIPSTSSVTTSSPNSLKCPHNYSNISQLSKPQTRQ